MSAELRSCGHCHRVRAPAELLLVVRVDGRSRRFVCRPSIGEGCFANVGPRAVETIGLAVTNHGGYQ